MNLYTDAAPRADAAARPAPRIAVRPPEGRPAAARESAAATNAVKQREREKVEWWDGVR
jgi:hypothetical protein